MAATIINRNRAVTIRRPRETKVVLDAERKTHFCTQKEYMPAKNIPARRDSINFHHLFPHFVSQQIFLSVTSFPQKTFQKQ